MQFDYSKLRGRIIEVCGSQAAFAKLMNMSERTLSLKLSCKRAWKQPEICQALEVLKLSKDDIKEFFFETKVQNI